MSNEEAGEFPAAAMDACCSPLAAQPLSQEQAAQLSQVFKALADPVRLRILSLIASNAGGEVCVCDVTATFELTGPTISHHLKVLRESGLITGQRRGTWIYYRAHPEALERVSALLVPGEPGAPAEVGA